MISRLFQAGMYFLSVDFFCRTWEEILTENPSALVQQKALLDVTFSIDELIPPQQNDIPIEDDGFHLPTISENLLNRFKHIVASMTEPLQMNSLNLVLYQLEQYADNSLLVVWLFSHILIIM